jgi:hypothetical protein
MDAPLEKMGRIFALLFGHMAKATVDRCGEEGRQAVIDGIMSFGRQRGLGIRERVLAQGLPLTIENFYENHDLAHVNAGFEMTLSIGKEWNAEALVTRCPFAEVWQEMRQPELGSIYCLVDEAMLEGYNPDLQLVRPTTILRGHSNCQFIWRTQEGGNAQVR